nr:ribonuclease H-like domain, reverse transcriptase, RNA-dependent DNA polymerase [Tanacetum cinerariifolium]
MKSAFLYEEIEKEVYVTQPKGFEDPHNPKHAYRVVKALYGLHQAPKACVRTATTPYEVPKPKSKDEPDDVVNVHLYRSMIGSLMYLTASGPDIMFAVSACSRHQLEAYSDSDYAGSHSDRKSTTGGCYFLGRRLISWQCKKQTIVATSSTEAEYVAAASCCGQISLSGSPHWDAQSLGTRIKGRNKPKGRLTIIYFVPLMLLVVSVFLLVVLVHADALVPASSCIIPTGSYSFMLLDWFLLIDTPVRDPTPVREPTPSPVREPTTLQKPTPEPPRPPSPPPCTRSEEVGPTTSTAGNDSISIEDPLRPVKPWPTYQTTTFITTTSTRPPSPSRQTSFQEDISEGGGGYVSPPKSNEAPPTTAATATGGAEDSVALTDLSLKLDRCLNRVTTLENELGVTKKVLGGAVLKLVSRVKRFKGILQQRKRRTVLSDSEGEEAATKEQEINLNALHELASTSLGGDTTVEAAYTIYKASHDAHASSADGPDEDEVPDTSKMPFRHTRTKRRWLRKTFTSSAFEHFQENIFAVEDTIYAGAGIPANAQTIPAGSTPIPTTGGVSAGSSMDLAGQAVAAPSSFAILAADKGKAPMVDDFISADLLTEQERVLKNLHDYQLGEDLAKKLHTEQEAEFPRQQEELAHKAQAESVASPAAQDWLEIMAKIATNSALSKQLLRDDVNEGNMNERLVSSVSTTTADVSAAPMTTTSIAGGPSPSVAEDPTTPTQVPPVTPDLAAVSAHADTEVHANESRPDVNQTASEQVSAESQEDSTTVAFTFGVLHATPSSSRRRRKQIAKKRVTPIVDVADAALIKFYTASESDDDRSPYAPYAGWEMVPTPFGSIHAYYDMEKHTKHFTSLRELLRMVEKNDLSRLLGDVDKFYQKQEPETFETVDGRVIYMFVDGYLRVLFQSLADEDAHAFWRDQESWRIRSWRLYPRFHVHVLETVDGRVIYMFVDVSYPLSEATLERMLRHGLEVLKLLVGGDLTMAEQLVSFIKAALLTAQSAV